MSYKYKKGRYLWNRIETNLHCAKVSNFSELAKKLNTDKSSISKMKSFILDDDLWRFTRVVDKMLELMGYSVTRERYLILRKGKKRIVYKHREDNEPREDR